MPGFSHGQQFIVPYIIWNLKFVLPGMSQIHRQLLLLDFLTAYNCLVKPVNKIQFIRQHDNGPTSLLYISL